MVSMERWRDKISRTKEVFPWYEEWLRSAGVEGEWGEIRDLPLVTADVLERFYYHQQPADLALAVYRTSGTSSGKRKSIFYSDHDDERYIDIKTRLYAELLEGCPIRKALADMGTGHAASTSLAVFRRLGYECESVPFELPVEHHLERLAAFKPDLLYTMPSILDHIVQASVDPAAYGIKKIILVGEVATPEWQRRMAGLFRLEAEDIIDTLGSIEIGTIAYYSHRHRRYLFAEGIYAEGVSPEELGEGIEPLGGNESILALTSFARDYFPAVRYVTYDVVRELRRVMIDGEPRMSFQSIVKRVGRELKHGEKISLYDIEDVIYRFLEKAHVKVKVEGNALKVWIQSPELRDEMLPGIRQAIEEKIPEIGTMIRNRILDGIEVIAVGADERLERGSVKQRKLHY